MLGPKHLINVILLKTFYLFINSAVRLFRYGLADRKSEPYLYVVTNITPHRNLESLVLAGCAPNLLYLRRIWLAGIRIQTTTTTCQGCFRSIGARLKALGFGFNLCRVFAGLPLCIFCSLLFCGSFGAGLLLSNEICDDLIRLFGVFALVANMRTILVEEEREGKACKSKEARYGRTPVNAKVATKGARQDHSLWPKLKRLELTGTSAW